MSNVKCQMSNVKCRILNIECRMSNIEQEITNIEGWIFCKQRIDELFRLLDSLQLKKMTMELKQ